MGKALLLMAVPWVLANSAFADTGTMSCGFSFMDGTDVVHTEQRRVAVNWGSNSIATIEIDAQTETVEVALNLGNAPYVAGDGIITYHEKSTGLFRVSSSRINPEQRGNTTLLEGWFKQDLPIKRVIINGRRASRLTTSCGVTRTTS